MKTINLSHSFERSLTDALALPQDSDHRPITDESTAHALRLLYSAAHGRSIETSIGPVVIAPPIAPALRNASVVLKSRAEFVALAGKFNHFNGSPSANGVAMVSGI
jgi:hypothetical protein